MLMRLMSKGEYLIVPKGTKFTGSGKFNYNQNLAPDRKKYPHGEKTTPFPTRPVFLTPDRTDPRFKQNMAP